MKKINFIPAGNSRTASSRLRVYALAGALKEMGCDARINSNEFSEFLIIQKRVTLDLLEQVKSVKLAGSYIIYDIDDSASALWFWVQPRLLFEIFCLADLITVDTPERAHWITKAAPWLECEVIPNPVDYGIRSPKAHRTNISCELKICWFGSSSNFQTFSPHFRVLATTPKTKIVVCGASHSDRNQFLSFTNIEFVDWEPDVMESLLCESDLVCLSHLGRKEDVRKSNHKMITSISYGVPAIVSNTPEYARTACEIGAPDSIFSDNKTLLDCVETYRSKQKRDEYLKRAQPIIWNKYSPEVCASRFLDVIIENKQNHKPTDLNSHSFRPLLYPIWRWRIEDYKLEFLQNLIFSKCS